MKNLTLVITLLLFPLAIWAESPDEREVLEYSDLHINNTLSLYAGKINMDYFDDSDAYSVGVLLKEDTDSNMQFALGYAQPVSNFDFFSEANIDKLHVKKDEGILFFVNCNF